MQSQGLFKEVEFARCPHLPQMSGESETMGKALKEEESD